MSVSELAGVAPQQIRRGRWGRRGSIPGVESQALVLVLPALVPILVLSVYPLLYGVYLGFTNAEAGVRHVTRFTGLDNYADLFTDAYFWDSFRAGLVWTALVTSFGFGLSLGFALLLDQRLPGTGVLRTIAVLPWAVPPVVVGFMWQLVYHPNGGMLNTVLADLGGPDRNTAWLTSGYALPAVVLAAVWAQLPVTTVVLLAALQAVPQELREAAATDRAGTWATFRTVTWPVILPSVATITTLNLISSFNEFGLVYVMTNGAPDGALQLPMLLAYQEAFEYGNFGYAAALGNVMVLAMAGLLIAYLRLVSHRRDKATS